MIVQKGMLKIAHVVKGIPFDGESFRIPRIFHRHKNSVGITHSVTENNQDSDSLLKFVDSYLTRVY